MMAGIANRRSIAIDVAIIIALGVVGRILLWEVNGYPYAFVAYLHCFYIDQALPKLAAASGRFRPLLYSDPSALACVGLSIYLQRLTAGNFDWGTKLILDAMLSAPIIAWGADGGFAFASVTEHCRPRSACLIRARSRRSFA